jgi:hypothetical protein
MSNRETVIAQTRKWIQDVVVGCNFCPFAAPVVKAGTIEYEVIEETDPEMALAALSRAFTTLDTNAAIETLFLIFPGSFTFFNDYLDLLNLAEDFLEEQGYAGVYQLASFHPSYLFEGSTEGDPSNYTNRSPYPMLHLLREDKLSLAIDNFHGTEKIPLRNIKYSQQKGLAYMRHLWEQSFKV